VDVTVGAAVTRARITEFDPQAEKIIFAPALQGG
jgi:hypothetical protein